jgi:hypothetical protein
MKAHQQTIGKNDEWLTPQYIIDALGPFDLDPCSPINRVYNTAEYHMTKIDDGLKWYWLGRVWLNPPFNRYERPKWMKKMYEHNNGIMLVPAAMETDAFKNYVFGKATGILALNHRSYFYRVDGTRSKANCGCTICLVAYGQDNLQALIDSKLGTVLKEYA